MGAMDTALDTLFTSELALDAVYAPSAGPTVAVRVIPVAPDVESQLSHGNKLQQESTQFEARRSELAVVGKGSHLTVNSIRYRVLNSSTKDPRRAVWTIEAAVG
jgi:hypothetical protein